MTISRAWYVTCNVCRTPAEISTESSVAARQLALVEGFVRVKKDGRLVDLCAEHAAILHRQTETEA